MARTKQEKQRRLRWERVSASGAAIVLAAALAAILSVVIIRFPFDMRYPVLQAPVGVLSAGLLSLGLVALLLGQTYRRRMLGAHAMAGASAMLLVGLAADSGAWLIALAGWLVLGGMTAWGKVLFGGIHAEEASVREERGR